MPLGKLHELSFKRLIDRVRKRLSRSGLRDCAFFGSFDLSLNVEDNEDPHWQAHLYLHIRHPKNSALKRKVSEAFKFEPTALRPYIAKAMPSSRSRRASEVGGSITYAFKRDFYRRSGFTGRKGERRTAGQRLRNSERAETVTLMAGLRVGARVFFRGLRRDGRFVREI
ncbi:MAG: hypothetical protein KF723_04190 [Rhizobiaceae bacterium]|nr:hypothetical protein [Rhizobiaceae bacterium]